MSSTTTTSTGFRRCGRCRCPGHTKPKCYVYDPIYRAWDEPWVAPSMNDQARRLEHARIDAIGLSHKKITKVNYMKNWVARKGTAGLSRWDIQTSQLPAATVEEKDQADIARDEEVRQRWARPRQAQPRPNVIPQERPAVAPQPRPVVIPEPQLPPQAKKVVEEDSCPICMEPFTDVNHCVGRCGHQFHTTCLFKACGANFAQRNKCPTCRQQLF